MDLTLDLLPEPLALLRLPAGAAVPGWTVETRQFLSITRTPTELSLVADAAAFPRGLAAEGPYLAFRVRGPLPLHLVGVLAALAVPLAEAGVPIFPIATWDTDYLLVKAADAERARETLVAAGYRVTIAPSTTST
jgi:hypothetical protein